MTLREFDKMLIAKQYEKLYGKTYEANINEREVYENGKFMNLSLNEILYKFTNTMIDILNDLIKEYENDNISIDIFIKDDRLIYIGIFFILFALFIYFINVSS